MRTFLEVVTRTFGQRPTMLAKNVASVEALRGADHFQRLVVDHLAQGVGAANAAMADYTPSGQYLWLLDDDDECTNHGLVEELKHLAWMHVNPPAFILRMDHGGYLGVLPSDKDWQRPPQEAGIGCSAIVTRADVWMRCRQAWVGGKYNSDFDYIAAVWAEYGADIIWHDVVASRCQRISHGLPEAVTV